jgi:SAM-dependent methyltransferase
MANLARDLQPRRADYLPGSPPEEFIVPLVRERIEAALLADLPSAPRVVLDFGCGRQPFRRLLEGPASVYVSADVTQTPEGAVDVIAAIDAPLPKELLARSPFDFILCTEVLEHVADWASAFANIAVLLKPGGRVLLTCPHFFRLHEEPYDFWRPTLHALKHYANAHSLKVVRQEAAGDGWDVLGTLLASCVAAPRRPGLLPRLVCRGVNAGRRLAFMLLRWRLPQRLAKLPGMYLSNIVTLEKL